MTVLLDTTCTWSAILYKIFASLALSLIVYSLHLVFLVIYWGQIMKRPSIGICLWIWFVTIWYYFLLLSQALLHTLFTIYHWAPSLSCTQSIMRDLLAKNYDLIEIISIFPSPRFAKSVAICSVFLIKILFSCSCGGPQGIECTKISEMSTTSRTNSSTSREFSNHFAFLFLKFCLCVIIKKLYI